jgi:hypothetical protein
MRQQALESMGAAGQRQTSISVSKGLNSISTKSIFATLAALRSVVADIYRPKRQQRLAEGKDEAVRTADNPMNLVFPSFLASSIALTLSSMGVFLSTRWRSQISGADPRLRMDWSIQC